MTLDNNNNASTNSRQIGLESFFPLLDIDSSLIKNKKQEKSVLTTILIQRRSSNSDIWICNSCTLTGDRWFMEKQLCKQNITNNFAKVAQRFQDYF